MLEELHDVERNDLAGVRAAGDETPVGRHGGEVIGEQRPARGVDHGVDAAPARRIADGVGHSRLAVREHDVGAERPDGLDLLRRADGRDHASAGDARRLYRGTRDPPEAEGTSTVSPLARLPPRRPSTRLC